jgi:hypothetical protein
VINALDFVLGCVGIFFLNHMSKKKHQIKIKSCKNKFFWYRIESKKPMRSIYPNKSKKVFTAQEIEDTSYLLIEHKGIVHKDDIIILN